MMKDVSLKGKTGISNERIVNKIQDFVWDEVLSRYVKKLQVKMVFYTLMKFKV